MMTKNIKKYLTAGLVCCGITVGFTSCSDDHMGNVNIDSTKTLTIDANSQLTTALLQTYGAFGLMDTYRSYITGFTQHLAGGWKIRLVLSGTSITALPSRTCATLWLILLICPI